MSFAPAALRFDSKSAESLYQRYYQAYNRKSIKELGFAILEARFSVDSKSLTAMKKSLLTFILKCDYHQVYQLSSLLEKRTVELMFHNEFLCNSYYMQHILVSHKIFSSINILTESKPSKVPEHYSFVSVRYSNFPNLLYCLWR